MSEYYFFEKADDVFFDDGEGGKVTIGEHLEYLYNENGTPDFMTSMKGINYQQAKFEAGSLSNKHLTGIYLVDASILKVVHVFEKPEPVADNEISL